MDDGQVAGTRPDVSPSSAVAMGRDVLFRDLYESRYDPMVRVALLLVDRLEVAEDVVQDAFTIVYRRWDDLDSPAAYLRLTVVNRSRDLLRRRRIRERHALAAGAVQDAPDEMADAIACLPADQRTALVLRFYEDLTIHQIAELMNCRKGTVKSWLHRALGQLREAIEQ